VATVELTITIYRPVEDVFRVLSDPATTPRWSVNAIEVHVTTAGPVGVGSRRRATVRRFGGGTTQNEIEVTAFEPNRRIALRSIESPVPFNTAYTLTPIGLGTRVDWDWDFELKGGLRLVAPLIRSMFARSFRADLARLKSMMEAGQL
jgi:uncharacterized protein YndB with AHSA1/START domain